MKTIEQLLEELSDLNAIVRDDVNNFSTWLAIGNRDFLNLDVDSKEAFEAFVKDFILNNPYSDLIDDRPNHN
jgi:hypothetical protein